MRSFYYPIFAKWNKRGTIAAFSYEVSLGDPPGGRPQPDFFSLENIKSKLELLSLRQYFVGTPQYARQEAYKMALLMHPEQALASRPKADEQSSALKVATPQS